MSATPDYYASAPWRMSWWEYAAQQGLPTRVGPRRIERGSRAVKPAPRDYLSEPFSGPIDYLNLPLDILRRRD